MKLVYKHNPLHSYFEPQSEYDLKIIEQVIRLEKITEIYDQPDVETEITVKPVEYSDNYNGLFNFSLTSKVTLNEV